MNDYDNDEADNMGPVHFGVLGLLACAVVLCLSLGLWSLILSAMWEHRLVVACLALSAVLTLRSLAFLKQKPARLS